ncbi:MAG: restriction endonuclease subunit S [Coleofasciculus sp. C1-SOL-03]|jgi:type I restriction enzyme S subunit|uniref:restriction endonuclease subunit S n=1 Tax=Coleofasciculus sp. C1-SOL-03 TaxID=3069522 RepID=UPI0032F73C44
MNSSFLKSNNKLLDIPENWQSLQLGNILKLDYGKPLPARERNPNGQYPVFGSGGQIGLHSKPLTKAPVIVVGRKGSIGSIFYSSKPCWSIDTTYYIDDFPYYLNPKYVYFFLKIIDLEKLNRAASIPGLGRDDVYAFGIPIPYPNNPIFSLDVQNRIVSRIESWLGELKGDHQLLDKIRRDTSRFREMKLEEIFENLPSARQPLMDVIESPPRNGWSPKCDDNPNGTPVLKLGAVLRFQYNPDEFKRTSLPTDPNAHYWLKPGDVLISRSNTIELVGHAAIYSGTPFPCIYPDLMMRIRVEQSKADSHFLVYWLQSKEVRHFIQSRASGASPTMKKINQGHVCNIPFPVISVEEQHQLVHYLDSIQSEVNEMLRTMQQDAKLLERLEQSILEKAFQGQL